MNKIFSRKQPLQAHSGVVIHIALVDKDSRNFVDVVVPWIHGYTKEKDAKCATHIHSRMDGKGGAKGRFDLMKGTAPKKNVPAVAKDPIWDFERDEHVNDPMWVNPFKCFGKIGKENTVGVGMVIKELLYLEKIKLWFSKEVEEGLSRV